MTEAERVNLQTDEDMYPLQGASATWRFDSKQPALCKLVLEETEDQTNNSGKQYNEWPTNTLVYTLILDVC